MFVCAHYSACFLLCEREEIASRRLITVDYALWSPDLAILFVCKLLGARVRRQMESNVLQMINNLFQFTRHQAIRLRMPTSTEDTRAEGPN